MSGYAAGGASGAYNPPGGSMPVGTATYHFLNLPLSMPMWTFIGVAFVIFIMARHWAKFVNGITA